MLEPSVLKVVGQSPRPLEGTEKHIRKTYPVPSQKKQKHEKGPDRLRKE